MEFRQTSARNFVLAFALLAACALALLAGFGIRPLLNRWIRLLVGDISSRRFLDDSESSRASMPVLMEVLQALRELEASQRLEIEFQENWTPQALQQVVREQLKSCPMIVVSNREPNIHNLDESARPVVQVPASGMVTAIEPIMRACSGTWIAHGSGTADRLAMDKHDHVRVPPDNPSYDLRRVWLTPPEEEGYYYGFSNEGLWPLCHLAYVRPAFREAIRVGRRARRRSASSITSRRSPPTMRIGRTARSEPASSPAPRRSKPWRHAILTMTRPRSFTPCISRERSRWQTRATRLISRRQRFWRNSSRNTQTTRAWPIT